MTDPYFKYAEIEVLNALGQKLYNNVQTKPIQSIDISNYSKGIYFLAIKMDNNTIYKKIVLQ